MALPAQKAAFNHVHGPIGLGHFDDDHPIHLRRATGWWQRPWVTRKPWTVAPTTVIIACLSNLRTSEIVEFREYLDTKLMAETFVFDKP